MAASRIILVEDPALRAISAAKHPRAAVAACDMLKRTGECIGAGHFRGSCTGSTGSGETVENIVPAPGGDRPKLAVRRAGIKAKTGKFVVGSEGDWRTEYAAYAWRQCWRRCLRLSGCPRHN